GEVGEAHEEGHEDEPAGHEQGGGVDPHVWLDPVLMAEVVRGVGNRLADADAGHAAEHRSRAEALAARLAELDRAFASGLADCVRREFVTSHSAFAYLARRYGLTEVGISGLAPETEPSPQRLAEVTSFARERGVTTIFFETLVSPKVAEALAREVGVGTGVLDPLEGQPEGGDYFTGMERNLAALRLALGCR
ncbi:MAG: metal ABC transporter solute-binding protein, Zn/Mn family, partial [Actinomycetota bacterium]